MAQTKLPAEAEQAVVDHKKRGSKSASIEATSTATKAEISKYINDSYRWFNYTPPKTSDDFAERMNEFFKVCAETNSYPTVEKMALALGTHRQTLWEWEQGRGTVGSLSGVPDMIKKAKQILASNDADLVQAGKIPQITYIFRAKNFFGMLDKSEVVLTPNAPLGETRTQEELLVEAQALPEYDGLDDFENG